LVIDEDKKGIVGCGTIGIQIAKAIETRLKDKAVLSAVCDIDQLKIDNFLSKIKSRPYVCLPCTGAKRQVHGSLIDLIRRSDFVVEAASASISAEVAKKALTAKKNVLIMSVGGLLKDASVISLAKKVKVQLYIPSGALAGLDGLKSASIAKIDKVMLTTKKSPKALAGAPYLEKNNIDLASIKEEKIIFQGTAFEAVNGFPKNINVAATLSLASLGPKKTMVRIVAVPGLKTNIHEVEVEGEFGKLFTRTENLPSPDNPKTSFLAALSAIATLEGALNNIKIGT